MQRVGLVSGEKQADDGYREYYTVDQAHRTIRLRETTDHPASRYGQPVLVE